MKCSTLSACLLLSLAGEAVAAPGSGGVTEIPETGADPLTAENAAPEEPVKPEGSVYYAPVFKNCNVKPGVMVMIGTASKEGQPDAPVALVHVQSVTWEKVCDPERKKAYVWAPCITGELIAKTHPIDDYTSAVLIDRNPHREVIGMNVVETSAVRVAVQGDVRVAALDIRRAMRS